MPRNNYITTKLVDRKIKRSKISDCIYTIPSDSFGTLIRNEIKGNINNHMAVLRSFGVYDLTSLGKLPISGNVIPTPGLLKPTKSRTTIDDIIGKEVLFSSAYRVKPDSTDNEVRLEQFGGNAYYLKPKTFARIFGVNIQPTPISPGPIRSTISGVKRPSVPIIAASSLPQDSSSFDRRLKRYSSPILEIPIAYWAADEIVIDNNTNIIFLQPHHWLVIIANKITIGDNVNMTWEQIDLGIPEQPRQDEKLPTPPRATDLHASDGHGGDGKNGNRQNHGFKGLDGPEIQIWTKDINKFPSVIACGQDGTKGGKGQNGQHGQNGARGKKWVKGTIPGTCKSGPGNGGDGGDGGNGAKGGRGGLGGHGGYFNLYAPPPILTNITTQGFYIDATPGNKGVGGDGGDHGKGGARGRPGEDRSTIGCPTDFGNKGKDGSDGVDGPKGDDGNDGDYYRDAEKFYPIDEKTLDDAFNKPAIIDLNKDMAIAGDQVTAIGLNFTRDPTPDKILVDNVPAVTNINGDTMLTFIVPNTSGGYQKSVEVKRHDGVLSNRATLHIKPNISHVEYQGIKNPDVRLVPGTMATIVGSGFSPDDTVYINDTGVSGSDIQYVDSTKLSFKVIRPGAIPPADDNGAPAQGEDVYIKVVTADGFESEEINVKLDTIVLAVFGDSIQWGQGLREDKKFHSLVVNHIKTIRGNIGVRKIVRAHSGAIIGANISETKPEIDGEVPTKYPTIMQQVQNYPENEDFVDYVLLDGGINDITVEKIINPIDTSDLKDLAKDYCYRDMKILLQSASTKFKNAKIIVTGYYRFVTKDSSTAPLTWFLIGVGLALGGLGGAIVGGVLSDAAKNAMVSRSKTVATEANLQLQNAVTEIDTSLGGGRIFFAEPVFASKNAIFAPNPWVWGINWDLSPEDIEQDGGVARARGIACEDTEYDDPTRTDEIICKRASLGHPNKKGANEYARVINALNCF